MSYRKWGTTFGARSIVSPMRLRSTLFVLVVAAAVAVPAHAAGPNGNYRGKATSLDRDFNYGKVTVRVKNNKVRFLKIEAVTTTGCGGFMDVVFAPDDPATKIIGGSATIKNGRFSVKYLPYDEVEDQSTSITARFSGGKVTGTFESGSICGNAGRFTAKKH
jgi:major membrane immunogen (membrane-anchored lipoprotein)